MDATEYKKYHESFMQNNHGSSLLHTFICIFYTVLCSFKISIERREKTDLIQYMYEYVFIILPMTLLHTVVANYIEILIFLDAVFLVCKLTKILNKIQIQKNLNTKNTFKTKRILSISCLRGLTYLISVFSILAVDFKDFPRFLAKTEKFGYSFMDTGVGLFVLMSGLVHKKVTTKNFMSVVKGNMKFITVLVVLGIARIVSVKQLDYQEHVTEYGVHWNFFFTLAVCKLICSILLTYFTQPLVVSISTLILHECLLHNGLQEWVFSDTPRLSFVDANREGITSCLGYISMYLFAVHIKKELSDATALRQTVFKKLWIGSALLCFLSYLINLFKPASRTLANTGYCLYVETILMVVLTLMYFSEVLSQNRKTDFVFEVPLILSSINKNGLVYFLVANVTTGLINHDNAHFIRASFCYFFYT